MNIPEWVIPVSAIIGSGIAGVSTIVSVQLRIHYLSAQDRAVMLSRMGRIEAAQTAAQTAQLVAHRSLDDCLHRVETNVLNRVSAVEARIAVIEDRSNRRRVGDDASNERVV